MEKKHKCNVDHYCQHGGWGYCYNVYGPCSLQGTQDKSKSPEKKDD